MWFEYDNELPTRAYRNFIRLPAKSVRGIIVIIIKAYQFMESIFGLREKKMII